MFSKREIKRGEQITFDYHQQISSPDNSQGLSPSKAGSQDLMTLMGSPSKKLARETQDDEKKYTTQCRCGAKNCRGILF